VAEQAAAAPVSAPFETPAAAGVPAATFQPPQVIFQPPAEVAAPTASPRTSAPASTSVPAGGGDAAAEDGEAEHEGGGKRRRRRSRAKGRAGDAEHGGEAQEAAEADSAEAPAQTGRQKAGSQKSGKPAAQKSGGQQAAAQKAAAQKADAQPADGQADSDGEAVGADGEESSAGSKRRRRKRRRGSGTDAEQAGPDDPPNTVVHVRPGRSGSDDSSNEVQSVRGSTRLEAKRQRRREGRESGRRRPPIITESEFLARREAVDRVMVVRQRGDRTQIAVLEDGVLVEHYVDKGSHQSMVGNVYLGKVQNVLPSMEAAFVDIGKGRNAVLYAGEVNFDASGLEGESKRIESALKSGQSVLVQVTKDPVGHKGARLTSQVSLPGRYLVYVPGGSMMGISRKLPDNERTRLKQILRQVMPEDAGVIVRTAAEGASEEELAHDVARLSAQWESIERRSRTASPPELLYSEPDLTIRVVRDIFNEDFSKLVVSGDEGWGLVDEYVHYVAPHLVERLEHWQGERDAFAQYRIDEQLAKALERKVWLPSGGSLVIDATEAMTVIDVNTGKFTGQGGNLEETVTRNNLEAAEEIVRQLRLRDVGGIIVIDFIDMVLESNRELVLRRLLECLARDRTKHQVAEVTSLGLVQMTRKRVGSGLLEAFSQPCDCCNGRGVIISTDGPDQAAGGGRGRGEGRGHGGGRSGRGNGSKEHAGKDKAGKDSGGKDSGGKDNAGKDSGGKDNAGKDNAGKDNGTREHGGKEHSGSENGVHEAAAAHDAAPVLAAGGSENGSDAGQQGGAEAGQRAAADAGAGEQAAGEAAGAGEAADGGGTPPRSRRRRRAATREPGPPDAPAAPAGGDGQAPSAASTAAGV
jgi:ribonuclease E